MINPRQIIQFTTIITLSALSGLVLCTEALRIVALSPHTAELVDAAGGGSRLVGVAAFTQEPVSAAGLPVVSDAFAVDRERILALRPDLVVAWQGGNRESDLLWLEKRGILVYRSNPQRLSDIPREISALGVLMDSADTAEARATDLLARIERLNATYATRQPITYFFQLWHKPPMTFGADALVTHALRSCRAVNVFGNTAGKSFSIDPEALHRASVDIEIIAADLGEAPPLTRAPRTLQTDTDGLYRPSPGLLPRLERLCQALHHAESGH